VAVTEHRPERSLGELFGDLTGDLKHLVQQEVRLGKVEIGQKLGAALKDVAVMMTGAGVFYAGFLALVGGPIGLLSHLAELPWWQSSLIWAAVGLVAGGALISVGLSALKNQSLKPEQTVTTLKEDAKWLKDQVKT
jgi:hypothetical protein